MNNKKSIKVAEKGHDTFELIFNNSYSY